MTLTRASVAPVNPAYASPPPQAENAGLFSKLESSGAFSTAEKFLPAIDKLGALTLAEDIINTPVTFVLFGAAALVIGESTLVAIVPDDSTAAIAVQAITAAVAGAGAVVLSGTAFLISKVQGDTDGA